MPGGGGRRLPGTQPGGPRVLPPARGVGRGTGQHGVVGPAQRGVRDVARPVPAGGVPAGTGGRPVGVGPEGDAGGGPDGDAGVARADRDGAGGGPWLGGRGRATTGTG